MEKLTAEIDRLEEIRQKNRTLATLHKTIRRVTHSPRLLRILQACTLVLSGAGLTAFGFTGDWGYVVDVGCLLLMAFVCIPFPLIADDASPKTIPIGKEREIGIDGL